MGKGVRHSAAALATASHPIKSGRFKALVFAGILNLLIFCLIPFTQFLSGLGRPDAQVRNFDIVQPIPPPPPFQEPPEPPPPEEPLPEWQPPPPTLSLAQLELALNPGIGDALTGLGGLAAFDLSPDAAFEAQLFRVQDLDELPRPIRQVKLIPPSRFRQERLSGLVKLEIMIDEKGMTTVRRTIESSHPDLEKPAWEALSQWVWTSPRKNGQPVRARYVLPIGFRF